MGNIISYIKQKFIEDIEIEIIKTYIDEEFIIKKYYLDRLFNNFRNDNAPKHYIDLHITNEKLSIINLILNELINKLQNTKYKYFVKNNSVSGKLSSNKFKDAIIYGLYIIETYPEDININIFTEYIFDGLINMFTSISLDKKIMRRPDKYEEFLNNIYYKIFFCDDISDILISERINNIIYLLNILNTSNKIIEDKLTIIHSILIEIK